MLHKVISLVIPCPVKKMAHFSPINDDSFCPFFPLVFPCSAFIAVEHNQAAETLFRLVKRRCIYLRYLSPPRLFPSLIEIQLHSQPQKLFPIPPLYMPLSIDYILLFHYNAVYIREKFSRNFA